MKNLLTLGLLLALQANAGIKTNIVHIENAVSNTENTEIFVTHEGRVFEVNPLKKELIQKMELAQKENLEVELEVETGAQFNHPNKIEKILDVKILTEENEVEIQNDDVMTPMDNYSASNVESYDKALEIFKTLNGDTKMFSQCFNRAHIWAKQMFDDHQVESMKILIYYTKKYRSEVSKKWWFHIAPMISINGDFYVMDKEFTRKPVTDSDWEKIFTKKIGNPSYRCKKIDNIKEYYDDTNTNNEFCNIQHTSMYYWEPNDMSRLDKKGLRKTDWVNWEIRIAAKEAFKKWKKVYEVRKVE